MKPQSKVGNIILLLSLMMCVLCFSKELTGQSTDRDDQHYHTENQQCVPPALRKQFMARLDQIRQKDIESGKAVQQRNAQPPLYDWPLRQGNGFNYPGYYAISNFVDHDPNTGTNNILDYNCGNRTYDGHRGTDIRIVPFRWNKMANDEVEIIAAADGFIMAPPSDGNVDQSCVWGSGIPWNSVFLQHADGSVTWYGHMKNGSVTQKDSGDFVQAGEYLGIVGSSGNSTGPHLHFEVYDSDGNLIDPFQGNCNSLNNDTWWNNQIPYWDSGINRLITASQQWTSPPCPQQAQIFEKSVFNPGDPITFSAHYRADLNTNTSQFMVFEPDGDTSSILNLTYQRAGAFFSTNPSAFYNRTIPNNAETGKWIFRVVYNTLTYGTLVYDQEFWVAQPCAGTLTFGGTHTVNRYYRTTNWITSTANVQNGVHVVYDPENYTILNPGFRAPPGSKLEIKTLGCN